MVVINPLYWLMFYENFEEKIQTWPRLHQTHAYNDLILIFK